MPMPDKVFSGIPVFWHLYTIFQYHIARIKHHQQLSKGLQGVFLSTNSSMDMQGVSISTANSMDE
jgi:hypothetical protein